MFKQIFAAAVISTALVAGSVAPVFASQDDSSESTFWADRAKAKAKITNPDGSSKTVSSTKEKGVRKVVTRNSKGNVVKVERKTKTKKSSATARNADGSSTTVIDNGNGTRTIIKRGPGGRVVARQTVGRTPDHAINHTDGVMSVGIGGGVHVVIGPFGLHIN